MREFIMRGHSRHILSIRSLVLGFSIKYWLDSLCITRVEVPVQVFVVNDVDDVTDCYHNKERNRRNDVRLMAKFYKIITVSRQ